MCGKSPGTVATALMEMAMKVVRAVITVAQLIDGSGLAALAGTVTALVDAGTGFAHPYCPESSAA